MKSSRERAKNIFSTTREIAKSDEPRIETLEASRKATLFHRRRIHDDGVRRPDALHPFVFRVGCRPGRVGSRVLRAAARAVPEGPARAADLGAVRRRVLLRRARPGAAVDDVRRADSGHVTMALGEEQSER